jgi:hypothetical protein
MAAVQSVRVPSPVAPRDDRLVIEALRHDSAMAEVQPGPVLWLQMARDDGLAVAELLGDSPTSAVPSASAPSPWPARDDLRRAAALPREQAVTTGVSLV